MSNQELPATGFCPIVVNLGPERAHTCLQEHLVRKRPLRLLPHAR